MPGRNLAAYLVPLAPGLPGAVSLPGRAGAAAAAPAVLDGDEPPAAVLRRVSASGHPDGVRDALRAGWADLSAGQRRQVAAPLRPGADGVVRLGALPAVQTSETTCGSAVLVLLAAAGDPVLAVWLVTGRVVGALPHGLPGEAAAEASADARFGAAQRAMLRATSRRGLGLLPWPARLGTAPWSAARHARYPGVRYTQRPVDDADAAGMARVTAWIAASVGRGVPVPLYTGGDPGQGLGTAVPRHVVLAVPVRDGAPDSLSIYEPGVGRVYRLGTAELVARTAPHPALGAWTHVCWAVLPRAARLR
jgi:hypothetical protein